MRKIFVLTVIVAVSGMGIIRYRSFAAEHPAYKTRILSIEYVGHIAQTKIVELTAEKRALRKRAGLNLNALDAAGRDKQKLSNLIRCMALWGDARHWRASEHEIREKNMLLEELEGAHILAREAFSAGRGNVKIGQEGLLLLGIIKTEEIERGLRYE